MEEITILGAGITGLSLAWRLAEKGIKVTVLESKEIVGGLASTVREDGYCMDLGPHSFFTEDEAVLNAVLDLFSPPLPGKSRQVKIRYQGKYLAYPFTAVKLFSELGLLSSIKIATGFCKSKLKPIKTANKDETLKDWATRNFGGYLYHTFFKPYVERLWELPADALSAAVIPHRDGTDLAKTCRLLWPKQVISKVASLVEREKLPTYYPPSGYGEIAEKIAAAAEKAGARILLKCPVEEVTVRKNGESRILYREEGARKTIETRQTISTLPLVRFINMLRPLPPADILTSANELGYRSLMVLGLVTNRQKILGSHYVYVLDRPYVRIAELNEYSPQTSPPGENFLLLEIPCAEDSAFWNTPKEDLFDLSIEYLNRDGILAARDVKTVLWRKARYVYPIYRLGYTKHLQRVLDYLRGFGSVHSLGRSGKFAYTDADTCIKNAFAAAERLSGNRKC